MTPARPGGAARAVRRHPVLATVVALACTAVLIIVTTLAGGEELRPNDGDVPADATGLATPSDLAAPSAAAPVSPPARRCGHAGGEGPDTAPAGARVVTPAAHLPRLAAHAPPGTTFWLAPGTHTLGESRFSQVIPRDGQRFVGAPGAVIDGRRINLIAFGGHASDVRISHLTIQHFGRAGTTMNEGVVNHDGGHGWQITDNTVRRNAGAGVLLGSDNLLRGNCLRANGQYGFSAYEPDGVAEVAVIENEIVGNNTDDWERRLEGCGCSGGGKFWETSNATVRSNWVHHNRGVGLWADTNNTGFQISDNLFESNADSALIYEASYNARIVSNTFARNALRAGPTQPGFPTPAVYLSESGADPRAGTRYGEVFLVAGNRFVDNWSGLIAWENADRFAGSPANPATDYTTLVNPEVATVAACSDPEQVAVAPYYDDCRWKVRNLLVTQNSFEHDPAAVGPRCRPDSGCGFVGLISNWGSYPSWSPYHGEVVEDAITFEQNNRWRANEYVGRWRFMVHELWDVVSWDDWRGAPFHQDQGSSWTR